MAGRAALSATRSLLSMSRYQYPVAPPSVSELRKRSEWWVVDGEMHEVGEGIPPRERFQLPMSNTPAWKRRKMRTEFMRRTRLVLRESDAEFWCKQYMELYQELRENWERLYWDDGFANRVSEDHKPYESEDEEDPDVSPSRREPFSGYQEEQKFQPNTTRDQGSFRMVPDVVQSTREKRMSGRAFAPMEPDRSFTRRRDSSNTSVSPKNFFS